MDGSVEESPSSVVPMDSSFLLVTQDSVAQINVEHSKSAISNANEELLMKNSKLGKQALAVTSGLDSLDDVLFQPTKATVGGVGKFRPKQKASTTASKSFTPAVPPDEMAPVPYPLVTTTIVAAEVASHPFDSQLLSSQSEELKEESSLFNAPASISSDPLTTISCSSARINSSSQLVAPDARDLLDVEHSKDAASNTGENLLNSNEKSAEQIPTATSGSDSLDQILLQPTKTNVRGVSKFRPKPKAPTNASKSVTPVIPPDEMVPVSSPPPNTTENKDEFASPSLDPQLLSSQAEELRDGLPLSNSSAGVSFDPFTSGVFSSTSIDPPSQFLGAQDVDAVDLMINGAHSDAAISVANEKLQINNKLGEQMPTVNSVFNSLDDVLLHPTKNTGRGVGKFRPKPKAPTTASKSFTIVVPTDDGVPAPSQPPTTTSDVPEFISPPFDPLPSTCFSAPVDLSSELVGSQKVEELTDAEHSKASISSGNEDLRLENEISGMEMPTASSGLDNDILLQPTTTTALLPSDSTPADLYSQLLNQQLADHFETTSKEPAAAVGDGCLQSDPRISRRESTRGRKRKSSSSIKETVGKSSTFGDENEAGNVQMQLRKRKAVHSPVDEIDDRNEEASNNSKMDDGNVGGDNYDGVDTTKGKKAPRGTKRSANKTDKSSRRRKKASDEADPINNEPTKKKFSHSTRRNRRTVSRELLETPEEYLDPTKLTMKDLIILAEIKERRLNKEAEALKKSFSNQSADNFNPSDTPYNDEDPLASTKGLDPEDDQANHRTETSCTKLNYHSFMNRTPSERWSKSDTEMFYEAIRQFGTDFAIIQQLFPGRTRHQVKLKYKAEERKHPLQVADALVHRSKDHSHFERIIERLQEGQAEMNANGDEDLPDVTNENETQEKVVESEPKGEEVEIENPEVHSPVKSNASNASEDYFDWSQYGTAEGSLPLHMENGEYVLF